jgi:hypothetical protein
METFKDIFSNCKEYVGDLKKECTCVLYEKYISLILAIFLVILLFIRVQMQWGAKMASPPFII